MDKKSFFEAWARVLGLSARELEYGYNVFSEDRCVDRLNKALRTGKW